MSGWDPSSIEPHDTVMRVTMLDGTVNDVPVTRTPLRDVVERHATCANCRHGEPFDADDDLGPTLVCRRYPPSTNGWAYTYPDDWCGEHRYRQPGP